MKKKQQQKRKLKSFAISWGDQIKAQDNMVSEANNYSHLGGKTEVKSAGDYKVVFRGRSNFAPQKDRQLGQRSITHKRIATQLARLVQGQGIEFFVKEPESGNKEQLNQIEQLQLETANSWKSKGLKEAWPEIAAGLVYQNLSSAITTNGAPTLGRPFGAEGVVPVLEHIVAKPTEYLRFTEATMDDKGREIVPFHLYHKDWSYEPNLEERKQRPKMPTIVDIQEYILLNMTGECKSEGYAVHTAQHPEAVERPYVSHKFALEGGVFDGSYPLPDWKTNSSINDIQSEYEASCIRLDHLRNGMHISTIVNIYSMRYSETTENEFEQPDQDWAENLEIVKSMKGSYASGRIIVNPVGTDDPAMDGKIEVQPISNNFPIAANQYFSEESRAAILTAWGVMSDLFSISKPEKNNLRSQGDFIKYGIKLLQQKVSTYQEAGVKGFEDMLQFFGLDRIGARVVNSKNSIFVTALADIASLFLTKEEMREIVFGLPPLTEEQKAAEQAAMPIQQPQNQQPNE